jgi:predicted GNAT family acetyltransferase
MTSAGGEVVRDDPGRHRYEILRDGEVVGHLRYRTDGDAVALVHTEVMPAERGRGVATRLVADALADLHARGLRPVPVCPFVVRYLETHPE